MISKSLTTPEALGIPSTALLKLMQRLSKLEYINSIKVLRHGKACLEAYVAPYCAEEPHQLFSLSKSFTSCAIGLAQQAGLLSIHDKLVKFFPEYADCVTDERMKKVTLEDLLTMRSGHAQCPTGYLNILHSSDWRERFLSSTLEYEPGTHFTYNSAASYMLSAVISKVTGMNVREYLMPRLFEPLGIAPGIWECCPHGINCGGWGLYLTTGDLAKFAQLLLQNGVWQGKQLLPADYLQQAVRKHADNSANILPDWRQGYGYQFWVSQHGYRGDGAAGQYVLVLPKQDMAVAMTSCVGCMQDILTAIWEELLPELQNEALPDNPAVHRELEDFCRALHLPTVAGDLTRRTASRVFEFADNPQQIRSCEISFGEEHCALTFNGPHGIEQLRAGFGKFEHNTFQLTDIMPHHTIASAAWQNEHTLEIRTFIADGIFRDTWTVDFNNPDEPLKNTMMCACFRPGKPVFELKK